MAKYKAHPTQMRQQEAALSGASKRLGSAKERVRGVKLKWGMEIDAAAGLESSMQVIAATLEKLGKTASALAGGLGSICNLYETAETRIAGAVIGGEGLYADFMRSIHDPKAAILFGEYNFALTFIGDYAGLDVYLYGMREWKNITASGLKSLFTGTDMVDNLSEKETRAMLRKMIDRLCNSEDVKILSSDDKKVLSTVQDLFKNAGLKDEADVLKSFTELCGDAETAHKLMRDYTQNIEMLESLKKLAPQEGDSMMGQTVDRLIAEYKNQAAGDLISMVEKKAEGAMVDLVDGVGFEFGKVDKVIQAVLGDYEPLNTLDTVMATAQLRPMAVAAYQESLQVIQSGNYTQADMNNYINSFNLCKELTLEQYTAMAGYYDAGSKEAAYLQSQITQLENMSYTNPQYATSYSEFSAAADQAAANPAHGHAAAYTAGGGGYSSGGGGGGAFGSGGGSGGGGGGGGER